MVAQKTQNAPAQKSRRERRLEILKERRHVKKIMKKLRLVSFNNDTVT
ncbi:hypothetical protein MKN04_13270 [Paenibacillus polymyxa]|nr:hypothetical protein [Paenibacillus polymyxa]MCH6188618.1 hypothetical protein [Paenibacillus polymyxa]WRL61699.1 hypothetical protein U3G77_06945 [Paenibacillus polymyxa]